MLFLILFACFGKQVTMQSPIANIKWQNPIVVTEQASPKKEAWEATSTIGITNISMAQTDCRMALINKHMFDNGMCHTVKGETLCKGTLTGFIVTYGIENNKVVCKKG